MKSVSAGGLALGLTALVQAGLRFPCSTLTFQRLDPAGQPDALPSSHVHHIVGGNAFNATMTGDVGERATCTTCQMSEDFSNYWTATLYFKDPNNGSYHRVTPVPVQPLLGGSQGAVGGLTVYYSQFDLSRDNLAQQPIKAFPPGFRMIVGDPGATSKEHAGLSYQCMQGGGNRGRITNEMPQQPCPGGIFTTHHFPPCWDGKNLDSVDHKSHMFNTVTSEGFTNAPACPASHPVRVPQVAFETVWDTTKFNHLWTSGAPNPFVWSFEGAASGYGTHADYLFGWKGDSLQRAMDKSECFYDGCGSITKQAMSVANQCTVENFVGEETDGWLTEIPGWGSMPMS
ncbi:uncharacterized protein DNG_09159 [Cephalotrichum gorgonifer]|uniref:DUF1996 domain-containing protein n=1 Tax=Cephalotrichum gorgonifer TaxID=2041049 RepID=A0AAE8N6S7_9PEZI|nr:uncharacterized protein DNG_09159 [Cephalotrichum gorgonifer]